MAKDGNKRTRKKRSTMLLKQETVFSQVITTNT